MSCKAPVKDKGGISQPVETEKEKRVRQPSLCSAWYPALQSHCAGSRRSGAAWVSRWTDRCCCQGAPFSCISESAQINHPVSHPCSSLTVISHQSGFLGSRTPETDITETLRKRELHCPFAFPLKELEQTATHEITVSEAGFAQVTLTHPPATSLCFHL